MTPLPEVSEEQERELERERAFRVLLVYAITGQGACSDLAFIRYSSDSIKYSLYSFSKRFSAILRDFPAGI